MKKAGKDDVVTVHYTGTLDDGTVFDSSREREEPLTFTIGRGELIPGFEKAVTGMAEGESVKVNIPAAEAYGPRNENMVLRFEREKLPPHIPARVGEHVTLRQPDGGVLQLSIVSVDEKAVVLDGNHPLAGKDLIFDIEVIEVS
jgi:peptidylprolyl isomerase